jgi:hypothetical protein
MGSAYLTTQLTFTDDLIQDILGSHPDYVTRGQSPTHGDNDTVFTADTVDEYNMETKRMSDGALLAWKTIIVRSSLEDSVCGNADARRAARRRLPGRPVPRRWAAAESPHARRCRRSPITQRQTMHGHACGVR